MLDAKVTKKYIHLVQNHHAVQALQKNPNKTNCCNYLKEKNKTNVHQVRVPFLFML